MITGLLYPFHTDEGVYLTIGKVIAAGGMPYSDIFDQKPPGLYYTLALGIHLWGAGIWWPRILIMGINLGTAGCLFLIGRRWMDKKWSLVVSLSYLLYIPLYQGQFALTEPFLVLCSLISLLFFYRFIDQKYYYWLFCAGVAASVALLFKQAGIAVIASEFWAIRLKRRSILVWTSGLVTLLLLPAYYFYTQGILWPLLSSVFSFYLTDYGWINPLTDNKFWWEMFLPLLFPIIIISKAWLFERDKVFPNQKLLNRYIFFSLPFVIFRPYHHYWLQIIPIILLLGFIHVYTTLYLRLLLLLTICLFSMINLLYSISIQFPIRQQQLNKVYETDCQQVNNPITYYLGDCPVPYTLVHY